MRTALKPLYSPFKWLCCALLAIILPVAMYAPTYYDFTNILSFYMPFIGIVLFSDIALLEKTTHTEEIAFISNKKPIRIFILRLLLTIILMLLFVIIANGVYGIRLSLSGETRINEAITIVDNILLSCASSIFIGVISMTFSTILNNAYLGYGVSFILWIFWNINVTLAFPLNPFPLAAYPATYEIHALIIYFCSVLLVMINCYFVSKSPFYLMDKAQKALVK